MMTEKEEWRRRQQAADDAFRATDFVLEFSAKGYIIIASRKVRESILIHFCPRRL